MISILILAKNEAANIKPCLDAVFSQKSRMEFEVVVVDSGSTDGTLDVARQYPARITTIQPGEFHHARTRNFAATLARGRYLVYLAADACPTNLTWLDALVENFADPLVGAVYGRQVPKNGAKVERHQTLATLYGEERIVKGPGDGAMLGYRYYHFSTVNAAIRKDVWEATQFPQELKVFEDVGIAKRILDGGWKIVYEPQATVSHSHDYPAGTLFKRYFDIGVIYQRLGIWNGRARRSMQREGLNSLRRKLDFLQSGKGGWEITASFFQDAIKYAGILAGRNEKVLPRFLKKRMSAFRLFD